MPTDYTIHPEQRLVRSSARNVLTEAESAEHYERMSADPDFQPEFSQLCDLTEVTTLEASTPFLQQLARTSVFAPGTRRAFVASARFHFGLARMLQAFCEFEGTEVGVFHTVAEAEAWLGVTSPHPTPGPGDAPL